MRVKELLCVSLMLAGAVALWVAFGVLVYNVLELARQLF